MGEIIRITCANDAAHDLEQAVSEFLLCCQSKNLSDKTVEYYRLRLLSFSRFLADSGKDSAPVSIKPATLREFLSHEKEKSSPATANHSLCTLRVFFGYLCSEGFIESDPTAAMRRMKVKRPVIATFKPEEVEAILSACDKSFYGVRDRAALLTLMDCGLRASELCGLELGDVSWTEQTFHVLGKGNKERIVPFGQGVRQALTAYIGRRGEQAGAALFVTHYGEPIDRYRLRAIVRLRCVKAGIEGVRCSPHTFRHTCAVSYLRAGGDTFTLQKLLGHTSQEMTRRYCESLSAADVAKKHREFSPVDNMKLSTPKTGRSKLR